MPGTRRSLEHAGSCSPSRGMSGRGISMTTMRPGVAVRPCAAGGGVALGAALFSLLAREEGWPMRAPVRAEADGGRRPVCSAMKEDKENARPKEKRGGPLTPTGLGVAMAGADAKGGGEPDKLERPKEKKETLSKVVIRRLPPSLTKEQLEEHLQPLPEHDYFEFFANDSSLYPHMFSRAYINFKNQEDIVLFRDRFDGYVFVDHKGLEYPAIVEFAPFQKAAKKKSKKKDAKAGTIEDDPEYKKFLETYSADDEKLTSTPETLLEEIEARNKELIAKKTTPLLNFLKNKQRLREEKREERRRRELERKRQREEERRKWKEEERRKRKEAEKTKKVERCPEKERDRSKDEPKIKLLKKPEKDERDFEKKEKAKKLEKESLREEKAASAISSAPAKRSEGEVKEEKAKKLEDDCGKDYREREREYDRDREYERIQRERDKLRRQEDERRRQKERFEKEKVFRRKEEDMKKERDSLREKGKRSELPDYLGNMEKPEKVTKEDKKEDLAKRDRIRNKDRPAMQLYQPGARSRSRLCAYDESSSKSPDKAVDKKLECEMINAKEED
ncbi:regulator of nonsense transcripts 3B-like isoform X3 [Heteronotia binoei]|uniref:regulator of nonsense transcripts 3B-like isoform X3 n=1 Tax=Heteronotia binoei TaxID=13085 RepID=UPI00292E4EA2|nr:regulator of nonsense transcripts 3B-like isoform X3 [Heteronotia binoei]